MACLDVFIVSDKLENYIFMWNLSILYVHLNFKERYCMDQTNTSEY